MKKLLPVLMLLLFSSFAYAAGELLSEQTANVPANAAYLGYPGGYKFIAMNFTPRFTGGLGNVTISLKLYNTDPFGQVKISLYNATESKPDTFIANSTILPTSSITGTATDFNFTFSGVDVTAGKRYVIVPNLNLSNISDFILLGADTSAYGMNSSSNGTSWQTGYANLMMYFKAYNISQTGGGGIASFVHPTPIDGATNNTQVTLNVSCTDSGRVWLYFDQNADPRNPVLRNSTTPSWVTNATVVGDYYYKAQCFNSTTGFSANTSTRLWTFDNSSPILNLNPSNEFQSNNFSANFQYDDIFILNLTMTDESGLFGFRVNITQSNGTSVFNMTNTTLNNLTVYNLSRVLNISTWPNNTEYNIEVIVADSHTSFKIDEYDKKFKVDGWQFGTPEGNLITISADSPGLFEANRASDRYEFHANFLFGGKKKFTVECDNELHYLPMSKYKGHFVCWSGASGNWIDFEGTEEAPVVTKINENKFTLEYQDMQMATFKSLGGLNEINKTFKWYRGAFSHRASTVLTQQNATLILNMTYNASISDIDAGIYYNGSYYPTSKTTTAKYIWFSAVVPAPLITLAENVTYFWNVSVKQNNVGGASNRSNSSMRFQHEVSPFGIDLCTGFTTRALNFSIFEENNRTPLNASIFANFNITQDMVSYRGVSFSDANTANFSLCITPPNSTFLLDGYLQYTAEGTITERYYIFNMTVNSSTQNIYLYNFRSSSGLSRLALETDNSILQTETGVIVKMQRYYPENNTYLTVQLDKSDELGQSVFWVYQSFIDYKFIFEKNGRVVYISNPLKFVCSTSTECTQIFVLPSDSDFDSYAGMTSSFTYNNLTGMVTLTWSDTNNNVDSVRLLVEKQQPNGAITICDTTATTTSGTLLCNVTNHYGTITARALRAASTPDPFGVILIEKIIDKIKDIVSSELGDTNSFGGFASFFIILTFGTFGALGGTIGLIVGTLIGAIISYLLTLTSQMTLTAVISIVFIGLFVIFAIKKKDSGGGR